MVAAAFQIKGFTINQSFILFAQAPVQIAHFSGVRLHFYQCLGRLFSLKASF